MAKSRNPRATSRDAATEVADIIRKAGARFIERYRVSLTWAQLKVLTAIERCRTAALGGHRDQCVRCGYEATSYCSCRNRHCPKCQTNAREKWLRARQRELLPVGYYHLVFSVPHSLVTLMWAEQESPVCSFVRGPAPLHCLKLPLIQSILVLVSVFSASCIRRVRPYKDIPIFIVSSLAVGCRRMASAGFLHDRVSSYRLKS